MSRRVEEYIEVIYELSEGGKQVRVTDVASKLKLSLPTVTEMFQKLADQGYVNYRPYYGATLTARGQDLAIELERKHRALKEFFVLLGLSDKKADEEACRLEHVVDPEIVEKLIHFVEILSERGERSVMVESPHRGGAYEG